MVAHNNQIANAHFKKDWQGNTTSCRVRTWFNQAGRYVDPATSARFSPASPASRARLRGVAGTGRPRRRVRGDDRDRTRTSRRSASISGVLERVARAGVVASSLSRRPRAAKN
jgi:hypothetical protein